MLRRAYVMVTSVNDLLVIYFTKGGNVPRIILLGVYTKIQTRPVSSQGPSSHCKTFPVLHKGHEQKATAPTGLLQISNKKRNKRFKLNSSGLVLLFKRVVELKQRLISLISFYERERMVRAINSLKKKKKKEKLSTHLQFPKTVTHFFFYNQVCNACVDFRH